MSETQWLCSNMTEVATGLPMGGAKVRRHALVHWETGQDGPPIKVGLLAVSENWLKWLGYWDVLILYVLVYVCMYVCMF